jgi:hypothetical protein
MLGKFAPYAVQMTVHWRPDKTARRRYRICVIPAKAGIHFSTAATA